MKVKMGFVTNSSSTSFILVCDDSFSVEMLGEAMGISEDSPLYIMVLTLYDKIKDDKKYIYDISYLDDSKISKSNLEKIKNYASRDKEIYEGAISSDEGGVLSFFCMDAFEVEGNEFYLNYFEASW